MLTKHKDFRIADVLRKACEVMLDKEKSKLKKAMEAEGKDTGMLDQKVYASTPLSKLVAGENVLTLARSARPTAAMARPLQRSRRLHARRRVKLTRLTRRSK